MSQSLEYIPKPITAADVPPEWIERVNLALQRDGNAYRASVGEPFTIEAQSLNDPELWLPIMLHTGGNTFATAADRDAVLAQLWRRMPNT